MNRRDLVALLSSSALLTAQAAAAEAENPDSSKASSNGGAKRKRDAGQRYAAMHLIASNSSLKNELAQPDPSKARIEAYLDSVGLDSPRVREAVEVIRKSSQQDREKIAEVANMLHSTFFNTYPDVCPPDDYAPAMVQAWKNLDAAADGYPSI